MLGDVRGLASGSVLVTDVCVIGSGPAGMTVALELERAGVQVAVLESAGVEADPEIDRLQEAEAGFHFGSVEQISGTRRVGGNANLWSVDLGHGRRGLRLVPFGTADLEVRPWMPGSGWPITMRDLAPHYVRAQALFGLPDIGYEATPWERDGARRLPLDPAIVRSDVFQFADRTVFSSDHLALLRRSETCTVYHHAHVVELRTDSSGSRVTEARVATAVGREITVRAAVVVVAAGGLASTQLLLASDDVRRAGSARGNDALGRYFMDHPLVDGGEFVPSDRAMFDHMDLYDLRTVHGVPVMGHLRISDEVLRSEPVPALSTMLFPRHRSHRESGPGSERDAVARRSAVAVRDALRGRRLPALGDNWRAVTRLDAILDRSLHTGGRRSTYVGHGGWSQLRRKPRRFDFFRVLHQAEQPPHAENRVGLGQERDSFGMRRLTIDWSWRESDAAGVRRAQELVAYGVRRAGLGEVRLPASVAPVVAGSSTNHYLGTTRMSRDPAQGVVDEVCRVHWLDNLYVASTSVFPTGGFANPTLTLVAIAARIADTVRALLESGTA